MNIFSIKEYFGLSKSIYILFLARLVNKAGDFVNVFLALFLSQRLKLSIKETGLYIMLLSITKMIGGMISGRAADFLGRKKIIVFVQCVSSLLLLPCGFLGNSIIIVWILIIYGFFLGAAKPLNGAMVADIVKNEDRKKAFSLIYLGENIGAAVGPVFAGFLFVKYTPWIFFGDSLTAIAALVLIAIFVKETIPQKQELEQQDVSENIHEKAEKGGIFNVLLKRPLIIFFSLLIMIANIIYMQHAFIIPLQLKEIFQEKGTIYFGYIMSINGIIVILLSAFLLKITRKIDSILIIAFATLLYCAGFGLLSFANNFPLFVLSTIIWTFGEILLFTNYNVYVAKYTPKSHRGGFYGFVSTVVGLSYVLYPLFSGFLMDSLGTKFSWIIISIIAFFSFLGFMVLSAVEKKINRALINRLETGE